MSNEGINLSKSDTATDEPTNAELNLDKSSNGAPGEQTSGMIRIPQLAGRPKTLNYVPGETVDQALRRANIQAGHGQTITLNGDEVSGTTVLEPDSVLVVVGKITNG